MKRNVGERKMMKKWAVVIMLQSKMELYPRIIIFLSRMISPLATLRMMRAQFPRIDQASVPPFILQSQLYSSVSDRTQVDREFRVFTKGESCSYFQTKHWTR